MTGIPTGAYYRLAGPGLLKIFGAALLLAPLPFQHFILPRTVELRKSIERFDADIKSTVERGLRTKLEWQSNTHKLREVVGDGKNSRSPDYDVGQINSLFLELSKTGKEILDIEGGISEAYDGNIEAKAELSKIENAVARMLFWVSLSGGVLALVGLLWETHRKAIKDFGEET